MKDFELIKKDVESRAKLTGKQIPYEALRKFLLLFMSPMYDMFDKIDYKIIKDGDY